MFHARQQAARAMLVAQADLIAVTLFGGASASQVQEFIRTGHMDMSGGEPRMEYDQDTLREIVRQSGGMMGALKD